MRKFHIILIAFTYVLNIKTAEAQTMVVTDPGAYTYFTGIDKKLQEELGFLQKIQDADLQIQSSVSGNKKMGYGVNSNTTAYDDFFQLRNAMSIDPNAQASEKPTTIAKNLDLIFVPLKVKIPNNPSSKTDNTMAKKSYQQNSIKAAAIFSEMILSGSKSRVSQIKALANDIDGTSTLKEALDVENRLIIELLIEARNTNILLANMTKIMAAKDYEGSIIADYTQEDENNVDDLIKGRSGLGVSMMRPSKGGKFTTIAK